MQLEPRKNWDIFSMVILTILLIIIIYVFPESLIRTIVGLPFLLFFPGYLAIAALFPAREDLDDIERVALSFGLSIAITPLIGFGLNYTPFGIRLTPILLSVSAFIIIVAIVALYRRQQLEDPFVPIDPLVKWKGTWQSFQAEKGLDKALSVILVISILSSVFALGYVIAFPKQGESFTEFYILGPDGKASDYPQPSVGQEGSVIIGLVNHEHQTMNYTILVWLVKLQFVDNETVIDNMYFYESINVEGLEHVPVNIEDQWTSQWEYDYDFNIFTVDAPLDGNYKLWFSLYKDNITVDYEAGTDYKNDEEASQSIVDAVKNERQSLNLNMRLKPTLFYLLDSEGNTTSNLGNVTIGEAQSMTVGLVNHEHQLMNYSVLVLLANLSTSTVNGTVVVQFNDLYYLDTFSNSNTTNVSHVTVQKGDSWSPQIEENFTFTLNNNTLEGQATLWFILYKNDNPPTLDTSTNLKNNTVAQDIILDARSGDFQYIVWSLFLAY